MIYKFQEIKFYNKNLSSFFYMTRYKNQKYIKINPGDNVLRIDTNRILLSPHNTQSLDFYVLYNLKLYDEPTK